MAHALRRISYATCDPENLQFAFLAREPKAQPNIQYCHAFVTTTSEAAEELNTIMGEVFRLAYAQQRLNLVSSNPVLLPQFGKHVPVTQVQHTPLNVTHSSSVNQDNSVNRITSRHKHHRHHRHKLRDATTSTCEQPVGLSDSLEPTALKIVESERIILQSDHLKPPPPPPRSQLPVTSSTQFSPQDVISTNHQGPISKHHEKLLGSVINKNQHEVTEDVAIVLPLKTKSTITPSLQHFYDMADHRSCGGITLDKEVPISEKDIQESSNEFSTDCAPANTSATTTTSSSTTGCSTATSGSGHPDSGSDNSLPMGKRCTCTPGCTNGEHACLTIEKTHPGCDSRLLRPNDQNLPAPSVSPHTVSNVPVHSVSNSVSELSYAPWYLPNLPRDKALEMLAKQPPGSFVIRDSGSHPDSFALSVRSINEQVLGGCFHSRQPQIPVNLIKDTVSQLTSVYPSSTSGITHFLIQKTSGGGVKLKGLDKEWPSLSCLVLHLTVMPEMLPCPLRLPRAAANPTFLPTDHCGGGGNPGDFEKPPNVTPSQFRPMCNALQRVTDTISLDEALARLTDEDEDYQRLSDFSSIMADLKLQPKNLSSKKHKVASSKSGGRGR
ncbi:SH2 domain-containing protein isoform 2 [Schistosoma japonicum]|nr:SH2 domain-containing protein isoform 2 [Schistosoma japonicum]